MDFQLDRRGRSGRRAEPRPVRRAYTRQEIIDAIRRWHHTYGEPPRWLDLEPARARRLGHEWRAERFESDDWPSARVIATRFGSVNAALSAAGLEPRRRPLRTAPNLTGPGAVLDAIREWVRRYGEVPTLADWDPARARRLGQDWRIARYHAGDWPSTRTVITRFGSMSKAVELAGLSPRPVGSHGRARARERQDARRGIASDLASTYAATASGPSALADAIHTLAEARRREDPSAVHSALIEIAARALAWADAADGAQVARASGREVA